MYKHAVKVIGSFETPKVTGFEGELGEAGEECPESQGHGFKEAIEEGTQGLGHDVLRLNSANIRRDQMHKGANNRSSRGRER